jgi:hypothetical protein
MRTVRCLSTALSAAAVVLVFQGVSQGAEPAMQMQPGHATETTAKAKTPGALLDDLAAQFDNVGKSVKANRLADVHEYAEVIGTDSKELASVGVPSDSAKRAKVEGYLKTMETVAKKLDEYGDANNADAVTSELEKGRALFALLAKQYPQEAKQKSVREQSSAPAEKKVDVKRDKEPAATEAGYYTCPMHPQVHQAQPGNCPICGMNLVYKKNDMDTTKMKSMDHGKMKM